jgi:uncharacterized protein YfiM (DUF2279 family)
MIRIAAALLLLLCTVPAAADDWTGADKFYHFSASLAVGTAAFTTAAFTWPEGEEPGFSAVSLGTVAGVGLSKELFDAAFGGDPSAKDFAWDMAGGVVALGINLLVWMAVGS